MIENTDTFSHNIDQLIYLINENESIFYIKNLEKIGTSLKINRLILFLAILKQGSYVKDNNFVAELNNSFGTVFYYYLFNKFSIRNHEVFNSMWSRSKTGHWTYIVK